MFAKLRWPVLTVALQQVNHPEVPLALGRQRSVTYVSATLSNQPRGIRQGEETSTGKDP